MWELDYEESWAPKNWCFWTVMLEKTLKSPLDSKAIKPVNPKGNQPSIFNGRTDAEAVKLGAPDTRSLLIGKDPAAGQDWGQKEKGVTEDEMVGWHHWLNGCEFEQTPVASEGPRRYASVHGVKKTWARLNDWKTTAIKGVNVLGIFSNPKFVFCIWQPWSHTPENVGFSWSSSTNLIFVFSLFLASFSQPNP